MDDLMKFLLARIAEDEELARDAAGWDRAGRARASGRWVRVGISSLEDDEQRSIIYSDNNQLSGTVADHIARHDPARVLAECEAKRRIVAWHHRPEDIDAAYELKHGPTVGCVCYGGWPCPTLRALALPYADHPDYREEWRP